ncbi:hypothetical protein V490_01936, partial [Pseudogymnoascus sp. VKM F-3557]
MLSLPPSRNPLRALHALETARRLRAPKDLYLPLLPPRHPRARNTLQRDPRRPRPRPPLRRSRIPPLHRDRRDQPLGQRHRPLAADIPL